MLVGLVLAETRNVYGYVFGLGGATGSFREIRVTDMNTGFVHWVDGLNGGYLGLGGIRWFKNNLTVGHGYAVDVYSNGKGVRWTAFYLPSGRGDFKAPDVRF